MRIRSLLNREISYISALALAVSINAGCTLNTSGTHEADGYIGQVDAGTEPNPDLDPMGRDGGHDSGMDTPDGGPQCDYSNDQLAEMIFEKIPLNEGASDLEQMIRNQRVREGFTLGQIFDEAEASATAYTWAGFKARHDANPEVKSALYSDIGGRIRQVTCTTQEVDIQAVIDELTRQMFGGGSNPRNFELRRSISGEGEPKSVYFANMVAEDGSETTYIAIVGAMVTKDGVQLPEPMVFYFRPMEGTYNTLFNLEQGGI